MIAPQSAIADEPTLKAIRKKLGEDTGSAGALPLYLDQCRQGHGMAEIDDPLPLRRRPAVTAEKTGTRRQQSHRRLAHILPRLDRELVVQALIVVDALIDHRHRVRTMNHDQGTGCVKDISRIRIVPHGNTLGLHNVCSPMDKARFTLRKLEAQ